MTTMARAPTPTQASWRSTRPPPARPTLRLPRVTALVASRPPVATSSSQSTFWSKRRSMPTIALAGEPNRGDLFEEDRVQDLARDRRRHLTTLAAPLDQA